MHVVAENSPEALRERELLNRLTWALRELTANLMRISRGAGKPVEVGLQAEAFVRALGEYQEVFKLGPPVEAVSEALRVRLPYEWTMQFPDDERERLRTTERVIAGALQVTASRLIEQKTQERAGDRELYEGVRDLHDLRDEMRKQRRAAERAQKSKATARPRKAGKPPAG